MSIASNRIKLLAIAALFLLPLAAAVLMFKGQLPLMSGETVNQGSLVQPPVALDWSLAEPATGLPLTEEPLGSWVVLFPVNQTCDQACLQKVTGLRQVHRATGREQERIKLVLLSDTQLEENTRQQLLGVYPQFHLLADPSGSLHQALQRAKPSVAGSALQPTVYLVDPLGNIMMTYETADSETRLSKDLKRLLKWSKQDGD